MIDIRKFCGKKTIKIATIRYGIFLIVLSLFSLSAKAGEVDCSVCDKIQGVWEIDSVRTMKVRIEKGVPWHVDDKYEVKNSEIIREFRNDKFLFCGEKTDDSCDAGRYEVYEFKDNEVTLRFYPGDNRFNLNSLNFNELVRFASFVGDRVPYVFGMRFIDDDTVESYSYVRGPGKDKMVKKDDNAYWRRTDKVPNLGEEARNQILNSKNSGVRP